LSTIIENNQEIDQFTERTIAAQIVQLSLFGDITQDDVRKVLWLLRMRSEHMIEVVTSYEYVKRSTCGVVSEYDLAAAHGGAKRISSHDLTSDLTANTVVLKNGREPIYLFYKAIIKDVDNAISSLLKPHQKKIAELLWKEGMKAKKAVEYMRRIKETYLIWPISETTFFENRRKAIEKITKNLKLYETLDCIIIDYGSGRSKDGECRFVTFEELELALRGEISVLRPDQAERILKLFRG